MSKPGRQADNTRNPDTRSRRQPLFPPQSELERV
jgi:hypothetical protein